MVIKFVLDKRHLDKFGNYPIKISVANNGRTKYISTGVSINEKYWNGKNQFNPIRKTYPDSDYLNVKLSKLLIEYQQTDGKGLEVKNDCASFNDYFMQVTNTITTNTKSLFLSTYHKIVSFDERRLVFDDITFKWLNDFTVYMQKSGCKINTCSLHLRNIRTVFNRAINEDIISYYVYPFRKFKIQSASKDKTYLSEDKFKLLLNYRPRTKGEQLAKDFWLLSFYLCGCNPILHQFRLAFTR